jgi:hypothetical protein
MVGRLDLDYIRACAVLWMLCEVSLVPTLTIGPAVRVRLFQLTTTIVTSVSTVAQPPNCRKDVRKRMYDFSRMYADVRTFGGLRGVGPAIFLACACRGGAASTEIASWGAAGCPATGAGRPDKWAEGTKGGGGGHGGHATRCGSRAHVELCINTKLAMGWLLFWFNSERKKLV